MRLRILFFVSGLLLSGCVHEKYGGRSYVHIDQPFQGPFPWYRGAPIYESVAPDGRLIVWDYGKQRWEDSPTPR